MSIRILVTGSRDWTDECAVYEALRPYTASHRPEEITVVHGDCPTGADFLAARAARRMGMVVEAHPADWSRGRRGGPERNTRMVDLGADVCLGFPTTGSRGTLDCMRKAHAAGIPVVNLGDIDVEVAERVAEQG